MLCARVAVAAVAAINRLPKARIAPTRFSFRQMATLSLLDNDKSCASPKDGPPPRPSRAAPRLQERNLLSIQRRFAYLLRCPKDNRSISGRVQLLSHSTAALQHRTFNDSGKEANARHALRINVAYDVNSIRLALTDCPRARCTNRLVPAASNGGV